MKKVHWYYKFLIIFLIFFSMFFLLNQNMSKIVKSSAYTNYVNFVSIPFDFLKTYNIFNYKSTIETNKKLEKELLVKTNLQTQNENLIKEVETLKETLKIKDIYTSYKTIYAKTINRNKMYWFNTLTIDKGEKHGIKKDQAVVTKNGLIGKINNVTKNYSTIKLLTGSTPQNKISVTIKNKDNNITGSVIGYNHPYLLIETTTKINPKHQEVTTSGLGNFPKNIYIGKVEKQTKDSFKISYILYVKQDQDMNDINYVAVLTK